MKRYAALALVALAAACGGAATAPASGLKLSLHLPEPIVPARVHPAQDDGGALETLGKVLVELRRNGVTEVWAMLDERAGSGTIVDVPPGEYSMDIYAGIAADARNLGVIRFEAHESLTVPPDELVRRTVTLRECSPDTAPATCDPDFGNEVDPPAAPVLFAMPARTGCDDYVAAGTKPAETVIKVDTDVIVNDTSTSWTYNILQAIDDPLANETVSMQLRTAWADDLENTDPAAFADLSLQYVLGAICWNPYRTPAHDSAAPDIERNGSDVTMRWVANDRAGPVGVVLQADDQRIEDSLATLPLTTAVLDRFDLDATAETLSFAMPATTAEPWNALLYVRGGSLWTLEGAFHFDRAWARAVGHAGLP